MTRYLLLFMTIFIYNNTSAFDIVIECTDVSGRSAYTLDMLYNRDDYDIMESTVKFDCSYQTSVTKDYIKSMPNIIKLEDGDSFQWYDLFDISYEGIKEQTRNKEYIDTIRTDLNTFVRRAKWSGDDTTTYKIQISITND